ncbi:MAG: trehalose-phosphatase [Dongiaceae bacterium]
MIVPETLPSTLMAIQTALKGAIAIVSGRTINDLMVLLAPADLTMAGEHGAQLRRAGEEYVRASPRWPVSWQERLAEFSRAWPGVEIEEKIGGLVIHYRRAPLVAEDARLLAHTLAEESGGDFTVLPAKMAYELRRPTSDKGSAVRELMSGAPFQGRRPVFIGDDVTDYDGFAAVEALGGVALHVERSFAGQPERVRAWLRSFCSPKEPSKEREME